MRGREAALNRRHALRRVGREIVELDLQIGDARREPEKQKENQRRLGVGPDHKTPAMKKGHRGTIP